MKMKKLGAIALLASGCCMSYTENQMYHDAIKRLYGQPAFINADGNVPVVNPIDASEDLRPEIPVIADLEENHAIMDMGTIDDSTAFEREVYNSPK